MSSDEDNKKDKANEESAEDSFEEAFDFEGPKGLFGEVVKRVFAAGTSAAFLTEEGLRNYLGDIKVPKDILNRVLQSAAKSKDEITNRVSKEIIAMVNRIDFVKEASRFVEEHKFKVIAEIEVTKKDDSKK